MSPLIDVTGLTKTFGTVKAVDGIGFSVNPGEVLGFLGPNGAGKTTTMRMIAGFLQPTSGSSRIDGIDIARDAVEAKRRMGYLPEGAPLYGDMAVRDFLEFVGSIRGLRGGERRSRIAAVAERLSLEGVMRQRIDTLSKGFKRRVGIAQAVLHNPPVLILDEPTDGLDPNQKHEMRGFIGEMSPGKAILISTHLLDEVEAVCSRVIVIDHGTIRFDSTPEALRACSKTGSLEDSFRQLTRRDIAGGAS
jgi:ABC-2 type transport system ATP-binding protein